MDNAWPAKRWQWSLPETLDLSKRQTSKKAESHALRNANDGLEANSGCWQGCPRRKERGHQAMRIWDTHNERARMGRCSVTTTQMLRSPADRNSRDHALGRRLQNSRRLQNDSEVRLDIAMRDVTCALAWQRRQACRGGSAQLRSVKEPVKQARLGPSNSRILCTMHIVELAPCGRANATRETKQKMRSTCTVGLLGNLA